MLGVSGINSLEQARFFSSIQVSLSIFSLNEEDENGVSVEEIQELSNWIPGQHIGLDVRNTDYEKEELEYLCNEYGFSAIICSVKRFEEYLQDEYPVISVAENLNDLDFGGFPIIATLEQLESFTGDLQDGIYNIGSGRPLYILAESVSELIELEDFDTEGTAGIILEAGVELHVDSQLFEQLEQLGYGLAGSPEQE